MSAEGQAQTHRENAGAKISFHELRNILQRITLLDRVGGSKEFAARIQASLSGITKPRGVKNGPFVVLVGATMPAVLTEIGFLSNPREEALLNDAEHRQRLAEGLLLAINQYAEGTKSAPPTYTSSTTPNPGDTRPSRRRKGRMPPGRMPPELRMAYTTHSK